MSATSKTHWKNKTKQNNSNMLYVYYISGEVFSKPEKKMFLNVQGMVRLTSNSCISAHKGNSFNSCEVVNEILTELLVIWFVMISVLFKY